jgi:peptidoglycan-associated lipoprotein
MNTLRIKAATCISTLALLAACSSNPTVPAASEAPAKANGTSAAPAPAAAPVTAPAAAATKPASPTASANPTARSTTPLHRDSASELSTRSVYFDFDQFVIRPEFVKLLKAHADYLGKDKTLKIQIQGNADERGSREYNLALGQKRADAIQRALKASGVDGNRIETISYGEEKPKAKGSDEASWAENRRGDILYPGEY